jgi:hypothetical protein
LAGLLGTKIGIDGARSPRDRQFRVKMAWINWSLVLAFNVLIFGEVYFAGPHLKNNPALFTWTVIGISLSYGLLILCLTLWAIRHQRRLALEDASTSGAIPEGSWSDATVYEYRSRISLLGWPLIHVRLGGGAGAYQPAKGWLACGNVAYGLLFACGGLAVGPISLGGLAIGGVAIGGCALGLLASGGMAVGFYAIGGLALGFMACGGATIAWLAACGGAAVSHQFALGGVALAPHANDDAARTFAQHSVFLSHAFTIMDVAIFLSFLSLVPSLLYMRRQKRQSCINR